jgi:hypothetical protein
MEDSAENSPLHLDYQRAGQHIACAANGRKQGYSGDFNAGNIGVLVYMRLTVPSVCVTPSSTISVRFSGRQMWLWRTFVLTRKISGSVDRLDLLLTIHHLLYPAAQFVQAMEHWQAAGFFPMLCKYPFGGTYSVALRDSPSCARRTGMTFEERGGYIRGAWW